MPIDSHDAAAAVTIRGSAAIELCVLLYGCTKHKTSRFGIPEALVARVDRFWDDGYPSLAELVVLANQEGLLDNLDIAPLLERLGNPVMFAQPPALEVETEDERGVILDRLNRLASDKRLRTRYVALLRDVWAHFDDAWVTVGRDHVQAVGTTWATRLASGMPTLDLCHEEHIARRTPGFHPIVRRAQDDGTLFVSPCMAGRGHIIALPGRLSLAIGVGDIDPVVTRREAAAEISDRLKALADPTRLTILTQLAHAPSGVTELARTLHIAQPTASVHLRQLREAGLVTAQRAGTRMVYSVRPESVDQLLSQVSNQLTRSLSPAA